MSKRKSDHVHKLKRVRPYRSSKYTVYACQLPDCRHMILPVLSVGKQTICWRCELVFIIDEEAARLAKPHCNRCTRHVIEVE